MNSTAPALNGLEDAALRAALAACCAAPAWVEAMAARRPFADEQSLLGAAEEVWRSLPESEWLEAFAAHPMIGDVASLRERYAATRSLAAREQAGVAEASEATLQDLSKLNREYVERFGFIFIICAAGKSADEMLALVKARLPNPRETELRSAAAEQLKITLLRLRKLAQSAPSTI